jgi:hypothetical protein
MAFSSLGAGGYAQHFEEGERFPSFGCGSAALWDIVAYLQHGIKPVHNGD